MREDSAPEKEQTAKLTAKVDGLNNQAFLLRQQNDRQLLLSGRMASWQVRQKSKIDTLADVEFRVTSQWGEDGIIDWLIENIPIPNTTFVEFGVENYQEANTRFLLQNRNWRGLVLDGNSAYMASVRKEEIYWRYDIDAVAAFVTRENINSTLAEQNISGDIGLLCIDIDGNDYWVLESITVVSPRILVCEYNPVLGDLHPIAVPYRKDFDRLKAHHCGLYFGSSIKAIQLLAREKGYEFVGTCSNGINAFFVRRDLYGYVDGKIDKKKAFPSRHRDARDETGELIYIPGVKRADLISHLPVVRLDGKNSLVPIGSLGPLYSQKWLAEM